MILVGGGLRPLGSWWTGLIFPASLLLALFNGLVLFVMANWVSVPGHLATPSDQTLPTAGAAGMQALPVWALLAMIVGAVIASFIAELRGHSRTAMGFAAVQILPISLLAGGIVISSFRV